jgi:patatin-like phospholipase/acyl hydrolase
LGPKLRILSIDGGGIRGVIPGVILMQIEKTIQHRTGNPQAKLADYFDYFVGTSTGGILTGIYLCPDETEPGHPRFTAEQAVELYLRRGPVIFNSSAWKRLTSLGGLSEELYSEEALERYLRNYFRDVKLSELVKPCLMTAYEIERRQPYFFSRDDARTIPGRDFYIRDVARATSAAPIYFKASRISATDGEEYSFVDGGMFANNPALCGITEALKKFSGLEIEDILLLSLGTGVKKTPIEYKNAREWGAIGWIKPILHILTSGNNEVVDHQVAQLFRNAGVADQYLRLSPELSSASAELDDASADNLDALRDAAAYCTDTYRQEIDRMVDKIVLKPSEIKI